MFRKEMISLILILSMLIILSGTCTATTYYVSKSGNNSNNGKSWDTALLSIKTALSKTVSGDSLWVAAGTYTEGSMITVQAGVSVYGGFAGNETSVDGRNPLVNVCIIEGNTGYRCITNNGIIDGFSVTKGIITSGLGGGILNSATGLVRNCTVYGNSAYSGGGINNPYGGGVINCRIYSNSATNYGGGLYNSGTTSDTLVYMNLAKSTYNAAADGGGGAYNAGTQVNCEIYQNTSNKSGGGVTNFTTGITGGSITGIIKHCRIYSNSAITGGGISNPSGGTITDSSISLNSSSSYGGGIYNKGTTTYSIIFSNTSSSCGGGICDRASTQNCRIYSNYGSISGGGIWGYNSKVLNCLIYSNSADGTGTNEGGGGVLNDSGKIINCTIYANTAKQNAGLLNIGYVYNCIVWNNSPGDIPAGTATTYNSCYTEAAGTNGSINQNPLLKNTSGDISTWDFHLKNASPCIDKGTTTYAPGNDFDNNHRPQGKAYDMGAYEYLPPTLGDVNIDSIIDILDINLIRDYILKRITLTSQQLERSDVNQDGKIDISDITALINILGQK